eukprot:gene30726-35761_t
MRGGPRGAIVAQRRMRYGLSKRPSVCMSTSAVEDIGVSKLGASDFFYDGVSRVTEMPATPSQDGTLTEAHIDFADMRSRTDIPQGDLFTVMEAWKDDAKILKSLEFILEIEAEAAKTVRTALVTRNTTASVEAFFNLIGKEWKPLFSIVLTREFEFVKPDKRLLSHVAEEWKVDPTRLLMVGDSFEPGANIGPPAGAVATFNVNSLDELRERLEAGAAGEGNWENPLKLGWPALLAFLDWLNEVGALCPGGCSFPVMGRAAGGLATTAEHGDRVLHLACSAGGLTKMMASQGSQVIGMDTDVSAAQNRGLSAFPFEGIKKMGKGSLRRASDYAPFDVVLIQGQPLPSTEGLIEIQTVLCDNGELCAEMLLTVDGVTVNPAAVLESIAESGMKVVDWQAAGDLIRIVAKKTV